MKYRIILLSFISASGFIEGMEKTLLEQKHVITMWHRYKASKLEIVDNKLASSDVKNISFEKDSYRFQKKKKYKFTMVGVFKRFGKDWRLIPFCMRILDYRDDTLIEENKYKNSQTYKLVRNEDIIFDYFFEYDILQYFENYAFNNNGTLFVTYVSGKEHKDYNRDGLKSLGTSRLYLCATNPIRIITCLKEFPLSFDEKVCDIYLSDDADEVLLSSQDGVFKFNPQQTIQTKIWGSMMNKFTDIVFE